MRINDKVIDTWGNEGTVHSEPFYTYTSDKQGLYLTCLIDYGRGAYHNCEAEDLSLADVPHLAEYMRVEVSLRNDMYWGMKGTITKVYNQTAKVLFDGYTRPVKIDKSDIEPLSDGSDIECWLDSLLLVKEY
jgi:hypothetical protein